MTKGKHRLSRHSKMNRERQETKSSTGKIIKRKKSLGALRKHQKTKPRSPDATGKLYFQRHTLAEIYGQPDETGGDEISCNIAAWKNDDHHGQYLTVEVSPEFVPYERRTSRHGLFDEIFDDNNE